jgi:hypothetical protein
MIRNRKYDDNFENNKWAQLILAQPNCGLDPVLMPWRKAGVVPALVEELGEVERRRPEHHASPCAPASCIPPDRPGELAGCAHGHARAGT